jgi:hypothetical protein
MRHVLGSLARRWLELHEEIKIHTKHLKQRHQEGRAAADRDVRDRVRLRRRAAAGRRRQHRPDPQRGRVRQAVWRVPDPCLLGQDHRPLPAQPRRQPAGQRRALPDRDRADALAPAHHRLRRTRRTAEGCRRRTSSAASSATSPARSTPCCHPSPPSPSPSCNGRIDRLDIYRSINAVETSRFPRRWVGPEIRATATTAS